MDEFFLVRSPKCYQKHRSYAPDHQAKKETLEEAMASALRLASETQQTQNVYKITLVGRAAIAEATWIPEKTDAKI
jgi:hypothetical protein